MPNTTYHSAFGYWMRAHRKALRITQPRLAEAIGCSLITLQKIESGERRPSEQVALLLAAYFGVPVDERAAFVDFARAGATGGTTAASSEPTVSTANSSAPWREAYVRGTNLPALLSSLIGREQDAVAVRTLLERPSVRLLTLTGAPGIGKTRLALRVASDMTSDFTDGIYLVELAAIISSGLVMPAIARALELDLSEGQQVDEYVLKHLQSKRILLLLDNFEQILDAAPDILRLLQACPWLKALITSREALHVRGERRFSVPPLEMPGSVHVADMQALASIPSVQLFVERAHDTNPQFELTGQNAESVAAICISLDGLPLAIELASARTAVLSTGQIRAALHSRLSLLASEDRDLPPRQRTVRRAIDWSYNLLDGSEQALLAELGIFVGGFTLEAAQSICAVDKESPNLLPHAPNRQNMLDTLSSLIDKSLLQKREYSNDDVRFAMLETIREYAYEQLVESGKGDDLERRHAGYFLDLIKEALPHLRGPDTSLWLARLDREHDNIRAALEWALEEDTDAALMGIVTMGFYWYLRGQRAESARWQERAFAKSSQVSVATRGRTLTEAGWSDYSRHDYRKARSLIEDGLALSRLAQDKAGISSALSYLGVVLGALEEYDKARAALEEAMALDREAGDLQGVSWLANALGEIARLQPDWQSARQYFQQGLQYATLAEDKYKTALSLLNLGWVTIEDGDKSEAAKYITEAMTLMVQLGDRTGVAWCLAALTGVTSPVHPLETARLSGTLEKLLQESGDILGPPDAAQYNRFLAAARPQADKLDWETAGRQGRDTYMRAQGIEQIAAYALEQIHFE